MEKVLLLSRRRTPDGTFLESKHAHDYVTHTDKNGHTYMLDGGSEYIRISEPKDAPMQDVSIYSTDPFTIIRQFYGRLSRGKDGNEELRYVCLQDMSDDHLQKSIIYNYEQYGKLFNLTNSMYMRELIYRQENGRNK